MSLSSLLEHVKKTAALSQVYGLISWDQETMMPQKGAAQRAEQSGSLAALIHEQNCNPKIAEWIEAIDPDSLSEFDSANVRETKRSYDHATKIPTSLAQETAKATSIGQNIWAEARERKDFKHFAPALSKLIDLKRQEAAYLAQDGTDLYDALLDQFEPGANTQTLLPMLESLREPLVNLREKIAEKPKPNKLTGHFDKNAQLKLAKHIANQLGYDFEAGRIDLSTHPFSSGGSGDSRITTRVDESDPLNCLYSTIHEVGHALYSQGEVDPFMPAASYCSMGVHESQSRFWENQIARSRPFMDWLFPHMKQAFPDIKIADADELYRCINRVETGYIRTEADEVHYNLHVLLRFELERELISGELEVTDLESEWNKRFKCYFGLEITDVSQGVLQDVHWSVGLFGYFPTYSLGNIYSACLDHTMKEDITNRDALVEKGETGEILNWLREKIHHKGRILSAPELITSATNTNPDTSFLVKYLESKYTDLYKL